MIWEGTAALTDSQISIRVSDGRIQDCFQAGESGKLPAREGDHGYVIFPGLVDIQVNGSSGADYSSPELAAGDIQNIITYLGKRGVTRHCPTIITNSAKLIERNCRTISRVVKNLGEGAAAVPGIHIEGPYISSETGPRGAHDPDFTRDPDIEEFSRWQEAAEGLIKIVTLAPERTGALKCIEKWSAEGVIVAIGHTAAEPSRIREAIAAGAKLSTHLGNGSHLMMPRHDNYIWEQLVSDGLFASLICDGDHLPPSFITMALRTKPAGKCLLISDVTALAGAAPGRYTWGKMEVEVSGTGRIGLAGTDFLAGAGHDLLFNLNYLISGLGLSLKEVLPLCTKVPERLLGITETPAIPAAGDFANFCLGKIDAETKQLEILETVFGSSVYKK